MTSSEHTGRLDGLAALVTGAASGIGRAIALAYAQEGAKVFCADINSDQAREVAAEIAAKGGIAGWGALDVTDEGAIAACVAAAQERFGAIAVLVNSAGIVASGTAAEMERETWERVIGVNLTGTWLMCKAVLPQMMAERRGSIINIASISAFVATPGNVAYTAAKGGVGMFTKSLAVDYAPYNIRANAICPGTVPTPLVMRHYEERGELGTQVNDDGLAASRARYPLNRHGTPQEIAALAVYLASDRESGFMTGSLLPIDGGLHAAAWLAQ